MTARRARPRVLYVVEDARWPGVVIQADVFDDLVEAKRELVRRAHAGTIYEYVRKPRAGKPKRKR